MNPDEPVEITDHDVNRAGRYRGERDRVRIGLATASLKYEHIGSTAVPGLGGRPIVDLMLGAPPAAWAALEELRARVVALGYEDLGDSGVPGRISFRKRTQQRAFDIALVEENGAHWRDNLALRDYLRAQPKEAAAYAEAKRAAVGAGATTLLAYAAAMAPALAAMLDKARTWRAAR